MPVVGVEPVAPALALVSVRVGFKTGAEVDVGAERVYLFVQQVAAHIVVPYIGLARGMVVLPSQSVQTVIVILGEQGSALADGFEIARLVIGIIERGGIGVCTVDMACHACHNLGLNGFTVLGRIQIAVSVAEQCSAADGEGTALGPAESVLGYLIGELAVKGNAHHFVVGVDITACVLFINGTVGLPDRTVSPLFI